MPLLYFLLTLTVVALVAWFVNTNPVAEGIKTFANIVVSLIVVGMVLWLINSYVPMAGSIKAILNVVVVVATCVWVLRAFGLWGEIQRAWVNLTSHRASHDA
jgi:hypothetical protein